MKTLGFIAVAALLGVAACSPRSGGGNEASSAAGESPAASMTAAEASAMMGSMPMPAVNATTGMAGKWTGPEGTSLVITPSGNDYDLVITNLDGPRTFHGTTKADGIAFVRDGKSLSVHRGSGADTSMKWLADKKDCLVVDANEGYCRD